MEPDLGAAALEVPDRLIRLDRGAHSPDSGRACAMEAASWLAGERWSDHPRSVHRVIAGVARWVNDELDDGGRQQLWPLILASLGTSRPGRLILAHRLRRCAWKARVEARGGASRQVWERVLAEHARLTGHRSPAVPSGRLAALAAHLEDPEGGGRRR